MNKILLIIILPLVVFSAVMTTVLALEAEEAQLKPIKEQQQQNPQLHQNQNQNQQNQGQKLSVEATIPEDFMYQNQAISPNCIEQLISNDEAGSVTVKLSECSKLPKNYKIEKKNALEKSGFIGYSYSVAPEAKDVALSDQAENQDTDKVESTMGFGGYAYYKYLGKYKKDHVICFLHNSGGSGMFSYIFLISREGDQLRLSKILVMGDRCNGGINTVTMFDEKLQYTIQITPYDYIELSDQNQHNLKAYDDLAACAACCQGEALFEHDFKEPKLLSVSLDKLTQDELPIQGKYQACFNTIVKRNLQEGKRQFTVPELKALMKEFNKECVNGKVENKNKKMKNDTSE